MAFTGKQWFQIISGINGGLITGAALLTTLFGQDLTLKIVAGLGIFGIILNSVGAAFSGPDSQQQQIKNVLAMPGVQHVDVNALASKDLATLAVDPSVNKIAPIPSALDKVTETAKQGA